MPRRNIELKARDPDPARSLQVSLDLGASDEGWLHQTDTYFRVAHGRLKLREEDTTSHLISYERTDETVARESRYRLVPVSDPAGLKDALGDALGVLVVVEKSRRLLLWHGVRIHLDEVRGLGSFIEIEAVADPTSDLSAEHRRASELQDALAITSDRIVAFSYSDELLRVDPDRRSEVPVGDVTVRSALSWSGGKDSALTLWALRRQGVEPEALITTVTDAYDRISMHGVRRELLAKQADAIGAPLVEVRIPPACVNDVYEARMAQAFASPPLSDVEAVAFGDLFLEDVRAYREERLAANDRRGLFPLWGRDTGVLAREFIAAGFQAYIVCLDPRALDASFAGRAYDEQLLADLPASVDPCGENGEFHTFVHAGPIFSQPVACETGEVVEREGFVFCDLIPA
jgi:uncharacterized protein (TIGR00290 family)